MVNTILGMAVGYPISVIHRFVGTARAGGYSGAIQLWRDSIGASERELSRRFDVEFLPLPHLEYDLQSYRYLIYQKHLGTTEYNGALLSDVRDVVFTSDPFSHPLVATSPLCVAMEEKAIGASLYNSAWIRHAYGESVLAQLSSSKVSCSGTTIGSRAGIESYLDKMNELLQALFQSGVRIVRGLDQGVHNSLLHLGRFNPEPLHIQNDSGVIQTVGYSLEAPDNEGMPRTLAREVPCIVHQFDRLNVADLCRMSDRLAFPIDDLLEGRSRIEHGDLVALWVEVRNAEGEPVGALREDQTVGVKLERSSVEPQVLESCLSHYVGDTVEMEWPSLIRAVAPKAATGDHRVRVTFKRKLQSP